VQFLFQDLIPRMGWIQLESIQAQSTLLI